MPEISEKELEDYLYEHGDYLEVFDIGDGEFWRQVNLGSYGIMDLVYVNFIGKIGTFIDVEIDIFELKKNIIDLNALGQLCRYRKGVEEFIDKRNETLRVKIRPIIKGVLIGQKYAQGDICFVVDSIDWIETYFYNLDLSTGIDFEASSGWIKSNENFNLLAQFTDVLKNDYLRCRREK